MASKRIKMLQNACERHQRIGGISFCAFKEI